MNIVVNRERMMPVLSQVQSLLEKRTNLPILSHILIKATGQKIQLYASDSEISFLGTIEGSIQKEGQIVVRGKKLFEIVKELPEGDFSLGGEKNSKVKIQSGPAVFLIHSLKAEDFPQFPSIKRKTTYKIPTEDLLEAIDKTLYCVSLDESNYHLTGVFCEQKPSSYRFVATDGHRMSFIDIQGQQTIPDLKEGVIIPRKGLQEIKKMISLGEEGDFVEIAFEKPRVTLFFKDQILTVRLIEGKYPDYQFLIPQKPEKEILINKEDFHLALKRISVLTSARFKGAVFSFKKKCLHIQISQPEEGEASEKMDCSYNGKPLKIKFNARYIIDILDSIHEKQVKLLLKDEVSAGVIQGEGNERHTSIVMPMKI